MKRIVKVANVTIGDGHIVIQSMTNTKTADVEATISQIKALEKVGCELVRVAVKDEADALAIAQIKPRINIPIIADIHYDYRLALLSIDSGADKIRINPGNTDESGLIKIIEKANQKQIPIRIGINSGSLSNEASKLDNKVEGILYDLERTIKLFENSGFDNLIISLKATDIATFIEVNEKVANLYPYPIHLGLTEAGPIVGGTVRSSYALGTLLAKNIGDTIRVSLTADPTEEIKVAKEILKMFNKFDGPTLISCPMCGRCEYNMTQTINELLPLLDEVHENLKIAVMGCVVNGIGEGRDVDYGIAGGKKQGVIFKKGKIIKTVDENDLVTELINTIKQDIKK